MIYYLTSERSANLMQVFLAGLGRGLARRIKIVPYEHFLTATQVRVPFGTYVFTSFGQSLGSRTPPSAQRNRVVGLHAALLERLGPDRVLNDPQRSLRRLGLLQALSHAGLNRFRAYPALDRDPGMRFPVFLRHELGTLWQAPTLIEDAEAFSAHVRVVKDPGVLAIEFCDTADAQGQYRKYGCFVVGGRIVPRHLFISRNWLVKAADIVDAAAVDEELAFLAGNPHEAALLDVCRLARIDYGRIDYAVLDGQPQVWEINTTPQIVNDPKKDVPQRQIVHATFARAFCEALDAIDPPRA